MNIIPLAVVGTAKAGVSLALCKVLCSVNRTGFTVVAPGQSKCGGLN